MTANLLRGALVGAGQVSQFQLHGWQQIPQAEIVAVIDPKLERAKKLAAEYQIDKTYPSLKECLSQRLELDFIDIAAPPDAHLDLVLQAAENKLPILCQKPFAPSLSEAKQMIEACHKAGIPLSINENWRWRAWYRRIKTLISGGIIGTPVYASFFIHGSGLLSGFGKFKNYRFSHWPRVILYEMGIHHVDVVRYLFGEIDNVYARTAKLSSEIAGEDRALAVFAIEKFSAILDMSWTSYAPRGAPNHYTHLVEDFRVEGSLGTLELVPDPAKGDLIRITLADKIVEEPAYSCLPFDAYRDSFRAAQQHFIDCLEQGKVSETHAGDNIHTLAVTLAAYESAEQNRSIRIRDFIEKEIG